MAKGKTNKNNPDNKASGNNSNNSNNNVKKNKLYSSEHCEKNCKDVGICEKYKSYIEKMVILHKVGKGILCGK